MERKLPFLSLLRLGPAPSLLRTKQPAPSAGLLFITSQADDDYPFVSVASRRFPPGDRGAVALMVDACGSADASADLGWTAGGNASVVAAAAWDGAAQAVGLDATLSVGASWSVAVPLGGSALVPAGPLTLTVRAAGTSECAGVAWRRVLVSGIAVKLAYAPPPPAFVVKRAIGSCMRGMQPLTV